MIDGHALGNIPCLCRCVSSLSPPSPTRTFTHEFCHLDVEQSRIGFSDAPFLHCSNNQANVTIVKMQMLADSNRLSLDARSCAMHMCAYRNCQQFLVVILLDRLIVLVIALLVAVSAPHHALALDRRCTATMFEVHLHCVLCCTC